MSDVDDNEENNDGDHERTLKSSRNINYNLDQLRHVWVREQQ